MITKFVGFGFKVIRGILSGASHTKYGVPLRYTFKTYKVIPDTTAEINLYGGIYRKRKDG